MFTSLLGAVILASSLSLDAFAAGFTYGCKKIRIPFTSIQIISIVCTLITGISLLFGSIIRDYIPIWLTTFICFTLLFLLGITKLLDSITKSIIRKHMNLNKVLNFSFLNFKFILKLYADPEEADIDLSKTISSFEATSIAIALSLDGIAVGFGAAIGNVNELAVFIFSLITNILAIYVGCVFGTKIANKVTINLSWISGVILILLAFSKFL